VIRRLRQLAGHEAGASLIEFAFILPFMLLLFLGGYQLSDAIACRRKVALTARAVADLTSQYSIISASQVDVVLNASTQVLTPYQLSNATTRVSEITTNASGNGFVTWSRSINGTALVKNAAFTLPTALKVANTSYIYADVGYSYTPSVTYSVLGSINFTTPIYMVPRLSAQVTCSDC
jgi:Flp pilus assembly protein TadG